MYVYKLCTRKDVSMIIRILLHTYIRVQIDA